MAEDGLVVRVESVGLSKFKDQFGTAQRLDGGGKMRFFHDADAIERMGKVSVGQKIVIGFEDIDDETLSPQRAGFTIEIL